jgi:hypothetical protein
MYVCMYVCMHVLCMCELTRKTHRTLEAIALLVASQFDVASLSKDDVDESLDAVVACSLVCAKCASSRASWSCFRVVAACASRTGTPRWLMRCPCRWSAAAMANTSSFRSVFGSVQSRKVRSLQRERERERVWCLCVCCAVLCCAVLCCAVLCCAVLCCAVLCCAVLSCAVLSRAVLCCVSWEITLHLGLSFVLCIATPAESPPQQRNSGSTIVICRLSRAASMTPAFCFF